MSLDSMNAGENRFRRLPVIRVFVEDLTEGQWIDEEKMVSTRYGRVKRIRVCGTVINRSEAVQETAEDSFLDDSFNQNTRLSFELDDGTGRIWVTLWGIAIEDYQFVQKGTTVDVVGLTRQYRNRISLTGEYARQLTDPNWEIYHSLKILERRKSKPKQEIETVETMTFDDFSYDSIPGEKPSSAKNGSTFQDSDEDFDSYFAEGGEDNLIEEISDSREDSSNLDAFENLNILDQIVEYIQANDQGDGVSITKIGETLSVDLNTLKKYLDQLSQDIRIYKTSVGHYSAY